HEVVVMDLQSSPWISGNQVMVLGDILDAVALQDAMAGCDAVYHCAAVADLDRALEDPARAIEVNVMGTLQVMRAASEAGVGRFMHASSVYVFSRGGSVYRTTKQAAENLVQDLSPRLGLDSTILRFGSLYGPRADSQNAILRLVHQAVNEGRIDFWGDGTEIREYIHINDAAALAVDALETRFAGQALHIAGRERLTTLELVQTINEMLGGQLPVSLHDEPFEGRYRLTPYSYEGSVGRRLVGQTYVDLGLGVLEAVREASGARDAREWGKSG
ncbi:MAG: NAD-dependent epimerase/dehydratase family protein, partial [Actinomycetota bacterium]|nr:NAD-dependent epimerase/dehydratase family protein [Actinomycetota bacterium]